MPSRANRKLMEPSRICRRNFCSTSASRSGSSSTTRMVAVMRPVRAWHRSHFAASRSRSAWSTIPPRRARSPVGPLGSDLWQQFEAAHARHIDVGQDHDEGGRASLRRAGQRQRRRRSKFHLKTARAQVAPELLAEQCFHIGLVIDNEYVNAQCWPPIFFLAPVRGSVMVNSVNEPGSVITSILPPCCLTTMSWLIDRPSPVPWPAGLVVKNGLNIF